MPGWVDRAAAAATELVSTVRSRSGGSSWTTAWVVEPESRSTRAAGGQLVEDPGGDAALDVGEAAGAGGERGLELEPLDGDGAAVHPAQRAAALEGGEVAADGLGGDPEGVGEGGDLHPAGLAGLRHDPLLPLRCVHRDSFVLTGAPRWADVDHQTTGTGQCKEIRAPVFVAFARLGGFRRSGRAPSPSARSSWHALPTRRLLRTHAGYSGGASLQQRHRSMSSPWSSDLRRGLGSGVHGGRHARLPPGSRARAAGPSLARARRHAAGRARPWRTLAM